MSFWEKFLGKTARSEKDQLFNDAIANIVGSEPKNLDLFKLATLHSSIGSITKDGFRENNERLEFLGDAVLSMVVAEHLFVKYPFQDEGFLTEIRSRIVKRETLNSLANELGIPKLVELQDRTKGNRGNSIYGNALEAVIGAVFLDRGYTFCKKFILDKIIKQYLDLSLLIHTDTNYKSKIIEWAQKEAKEVAFESTNQSNTLASHEFEIALLIDHHQISIGTGTSKKRAEQEAAQEACKKLKLL